MKPESRRHGEVHFNLDNNIQYVYTGSQNDGDNVAKA